MIEWSEDASTFVAKALSPAQVIEVRIDEEHRIANVVVPERMLSLAIGREGQNARLAAKLTGWRIDIRSDVSVAEAARAEAETLADAESAVADAPGPTAETAASEAVAAPELEPNTVPVVPATAEAPARPVPTTMISNLRLLAGLTSFNSNRCLSHFPSRAVSDAIVRRLSDGAAEARAAADRSDAGRPDRRRPER